MSRILIALFVFRVGVLLISAFLPFDLPHIWRQVDTLGVAERYFNRWMYEPTLKWPLLPAVLNSQDAYGIVRMEFPLLNLILAPAFIAGPFYGRVLAQILCLIFETLLLAFVIKNFRDKKICGVSADKAFLLIPIYAVSSTFWGIIMPDISAMLLILLSLSFTWENENKKSKFFAFIACSLGLLIKPTAVVVLLLAFCNENFVSYVKKNFAWLASSLLVCGFYYTLGMKLFLQVQDLPDVFGVKPKPLFEALPEFFLDASGLFSLFWRKFFLEGGIVAIILSYILMWKKNVSLKPIAKLWLAFFAGVLFIAAISGAHSFAHYYYFMGLSPIICLIGWHACFQQDSKFIQFAFMVIMIAWAGDLSFFNLRSISQTKMATETPVFSECKDLIARNPNLPWKSGYVFRTEKTQYPFVGLCFGEREGSSTSPFGLYYKHQHIPQNCRPLDESAHVILATCTE